MPLPRWRTPTILRPRLHRSFSHLHDATPQSARWTWAGVTSGCPEWPLVLVTWQGTTQIQNLASSLNKKPWRSGASTVVEAHPPWRKISRSLILELLPHRYVASSQAAGAQLKLTRTRAAETLHSGRPRTVRSTPRDHPPPSVSRSPLSSVLVLRLLPLSVVVVADCRLWERGGWRVT